MVDHGRSRSADNPLGPALTELLTQLLGGMAEIFSWPAVVTAVIGGLSLGAAIEWLTPDWVRPRASLRALTIITIAFGSLAIIVFWSGQVITALLTNDPNWGRAVARGLLQELFVIASAAGGAILRARESPKS